MQRNGHHVYATYCICTCTLLYDAAVYLDNKLIVFCSELQQFPGSFLVVQVTVKISQ